MRFLAKISIVLASTFNFFMPITMAIEVDPMCDYHQYDNILPGQQFYIYNKEYPENYPPLTSCRWVAKSPPGTRILISCYPIEIPATDECSGDRLEISLSGNENLSDSKKYCGKGTLTIVADGNALAVGLFATFDSPGGTFACTLTSGNGSSVSTTTTPAPATCDCGLQRKPRIVGGEETGINEFPEMAAMIDFQLKKLFCGCTIISNRYLITAAHCVVNRNTTNIAVLVGDHDTIIGSKEPGKLYRVSTFDIHPKYDSKTLANDIALIQTATIMTFNIEIAPVCLPFRYTNLSFASKEVTALGWGQLSQNGPQPNILQKVNLAVFSNKQCGAQYGRKVTKNQICTYGKEKGACHNDSGGPILWRDPKTNRWQLVGIISSKSACATSTPGINTRVTSYLTWITSRTPNTTYCIK